MVQYYGRKASPSPAIDFIKVTFLFHHYWNDEVLRDCCYGVLQLPTRIVDNTEHLDVLSDERVKCGISPVTALCLR